MARRQSSQLRTVLNSELAEAERQAANQLADGLDLSLSNLMRRLLKREYRKRTENYDPRLFAPLIGNREGGVNARGFRGTPSKKGVTEDE
jgi:hypothetical protein